MHVEMSALAALTTEKDIALEELIYAIEVAVLGAYNQTDTAKRHARAHLDRETGEIQILVPTFNEIGEKISEDRDEPEGFARIVTSTARQVIKMKMREVNDADIRMPELGRSIEHEEAVTLIRQWITEMPGDCN